MDTFIKINSSYSRSLTNKDFLLLKTGYCVQKDGYEAYYFSGWCPFTQEIVVKGKRSEKMRLKKKVKITSLPKQDWSCLDDLPIVERCMTMVEAVGCSRRQRKLVIEEALEKNWLRNWLIAFPAVYDELGLFEIDYDSTEVDTCFGLLLQQGIEPNPGPNFDESVDKLLADVKKRIHELYIQKNFSCGLNEFVQLHPNATREIACIRELSTPDHDPRFITTINLKIDGITYCVTEREKTKILSREKAAQSVLELAFAGEEYHLKCLPASHWLRDFARRC